MDENFLKLTNTTYQLLEYFPEGDSLKARAKEKVLVVMEGLVLMCGGENNKNKLLEDIEILLGYLRVGKSQGWVSPINYLIVCNEYQKIKDALILSKDPEVRTELVQPKRTQKIEKLVLDKSGEQQSEAPKSLIKLSERQKKIMDFLSDKEKAQVMDLQTVLPTVTKRTIRRDLDELLTTGKIVRLGEFNQVFYRVS
jgi:hypothetical protein